MYTYAYTQQLPPQLVSIDSPNSHLSSSFSISRSFSYSVPPLQPSVPILTSHTWLCNGCLLCLLDPTHPDNLTAFQGEWSKGQAVLVTGIHNKLSQDLWTPQSFERDFGEFELHLP